MLGRLAVFKSNRAVAAEAGRYACLAVAIFVGHYAALRTLVAVTTLPVLALRLLVEPVFFIFSFAVQRLVVFRRRPTRTPATVDEGADADAAAACVEGAE